MKKETKIVIKTQLDIAIGIVDNIVNSGSFKRRRVNENYLQTASIAMRHVKEDLED